jgi:hypothetical protein
MIVIFIALHVAHATLRSMQSSGTIVSLFTKGVLPESSSKTSSWSESLKINGQPFTCSITNDRDRNKEKARLHKFKASMSALSGRCVASHGINLCINDRLEIFNDKRDTFAFSEDAVFPTHNADQIFLNSAGNVAAFVTCINAADPIVDLSKLCRAGDPVPRASNSVILETFASNKTALVRSTKTAVAEESISEIETMLFLGCGSDGTVDESFLESLVRIESVTTVDDIVHVSIESPLCHRSGPMESIFFPLRNVCLSADSLHREIVFCPGTGSFKITQRRHRVGHPWPSTLNIPASHASAWEYDASSRYLNSVFTTSLKCSEALPLLSEEYELTLNKPRLKIRAVGGSFNPSVFPQETAEISGTIVYDGSDPAGCSESAFSNVPEQTTWIALVERGKCMFHDKALLAQKKGASAVIIMNQKDRTMIPAMASIPGKPMADIPAVLTDTDGLVLKNFDGKVITLSSAPIKGQAGPSSSDMLRITASFYCDAQWDNVSFAKSCQVGEKVKLVREGEPDLYIAEILERLNGDTFRVHVSGTPSSVTEIVPGYMLDRSNQTPCTAQIGTFIKEVERTDTCDLRLKIHSNLLCGSTLFREPVIRTNEIVCEIG